MDNQLCSDESDISDSTNLHLNKKKYKKRRQFDVSEPITSYGLILFSFSSSNKSLRKFISNWTDPVIPEDNVFEKETSSNGQKFPLFLIYQRRDNFEYMDFLRGAWGLECHLPSLFSLMSCDERDRIRNYTFQELWDDLWIIQDCRIYRDGFLKAKKKYDSIKNLIPHLLDTTESCINYPPWGFPKGKKNGYHEDPLTCAIREFEEETKLSISSNIKIIQDAPFTENFRGSNNKLYTTHYFLAEIPHPIYSAPYSTPHCIRKTTISEEASDIGWFIFEDSKEYLDLQRQSILRDAMKIIREYQITK